MKSFLLILNNDEWCGGAGEVGKFFFSNSIEIRKKTSLPFNMCPANKKSQISRLKKKFLVDISTANTFCLDKRHMLQMLLVQINKFASNAFYL